MKHTALERRRQQRGELEHTALARRGQVACGHHDEPDRQIVTIAVKSVAREVEREFQFGQLRLPQVGDRKLDTKRVADAERAGADQLDGVQSKVRDVQRNHLLRTMGVKGAIQFHDLRDSRRKSGAHRRPERAITGAGELAGAERVEGAGGVGEPRLYREGRGRAGGRGPIGAVGGNVDLPRLRHHESTSARRSRSQGGDTRGRRRGRPGETIGRKVDLRRVRVLRVGGDQESAARPMEINHLGGCVGIDHMARPRHALVGGAVNGVVVGEKPPRVRQRKDEARRHRHAIHAHRDLRPSGAVA